MTCDAGYLYAASDFSEQAEQTVTIFACCIQVVQTDEAVFEAVQDKFVALTANLLPKLVRVLTAFSCSAGCGRSLLVESGLCTSPVWLLHLTD